MTAFSIFDFIVSLIYQQFKLISALSHFLFSSRMANAKGEIRIGISHQVNICLFIYLFIHLFNYSFVSIVDSTLYTCYDVCYVASGDTCIVE